MTTKAVSDLVLDSRQITPGDTFLAITGQNTDGRQYIEQAVNQGARMVLYELPFDGVIELQKRFPHIPMQGIKDLRAKLSSIAAEFYGYPARKLKLIGITGTNGKTSCAKWIEALLNMNQCPCGSVGTLGISFANKNISMGLTTPDPLSFHRSLAYLVEQGAEYVCIEVSSHALDQGRIGEVDFEAVIFTNLTQDHLDYHGTMEAYWQAKQKLFHQYRYQYLITNVDDSYGQQLLTQSTAQNKTIGYSINSWVKLVEQKRKGIWAQIETPWGEGEFRSSIFGLFNLSNLLACIATVSLLGIKLHYTLSAVQRLSAIDGRMERVQTNRADGPTVIVDFAHTPDALQKTLQALRSCCDGKLWCVFGCGGERDRQKRPRMMEIAEKYSDNVVLTQDNSRGEPPQQIIDDMLQGAQLSDEVIIQLDRAKAITQAIELSNKDDVVLIAGKGHECYQIIGKERTPFSDKAIAETV